MSVLYMYRSTPNLLQLVNATMHDARLCLSLLKEFSALPLFLQITQIVGGVLVSNICNVNVVFCDCLVVCMLL